MIGCERNTTWRMDPAGLRIEGGGITWWNRCRVVAWHHGSTGRRKCLCWLARRPGAAGPCDHDRWFVPRRSSWLLDSKFRENDGVYQRFHQQGTVSIVTLPVQRQAPGAQGQDFAGQALDAHPRQNQESAVIHDPLQVTLPLLSLQPIHTSRGFIFQAGEVHNRQASSRWRFRTQ